MTRLVRLWWLSARNIRILWFALRHPRRPQWLIPAVGALGFFALEPLNFALPFVGVVDEFILLPLALNLLIALLPADIRGDYVPGWTSRLRTPGRR